MLNIQFSPNQFKRNQNYKQMEISGSVPESIESICMKILIFQEYSFYFLSAFLSDGEEEKTKSTYCFSGTRAFYNGLKSVM